MAIPRLLTIPISHYCEKGRWALERAEIDYVEEDGDLYGSTVIMASRIAAKADGGEILIPEPLRHLLTGKSYVYADRGETMLKGFEDAVRLFEVHWQTPADN